MRYVPRWLIGACLLVVGCAKSSDGPTMLPIGLAESKTADSFVGDGDGASNDSTSTSSRALDSCHLKATLKDAGPSAPRGRFTLTLKNDGASALQLVLPGDGSDVGWRTPKVTWSATANGAAIAPAHGPRCGVMNSIEATEIVTLPPGASREIVDWLPPPALPSGTYDLRLTYRNDPSIERDTPNDSSDDVKLLIAKSSACEISTNTLRATLP